MSKEWAWGKLWISARVARMVGVSLEVAWEFDIASLHIAVPFLSVTIGWGGNEDFE